MSGNVLWLYVGASPTSATKHMGLFRQPVRTTESLAYRALRIMKSRNGRLFVATCSWSEKRRDRDWERSDSCSCYLFVLDRISRSRFHGHEHENCERTRTRTTNTDRASWQTYSAVRATIDERHALKAVSAFVETRSSRGSFPSAGPYRDGPALIDRCGLRREAPSP